MVFFVLLPSYSFLLHKQTELDGQNPTQFMRNAIFEKLEDSLDYQDAIENIKLSNGETISREDIKKDLGI
ncbi:DUF6290 family protein [Lactobacillus crispatus]|uniref:DUF6290 family protein n=1 Tax=Lactobacillus crispatus TaxID=47770 RepID=UPI0022CE2ADB|nr:DUF6290 family protein [Lactobacillus crispatus]MCZ9662482.1 DUF6290 family protein [Lactobacillus crispatus]